MLLLKIFFVLFGLLIFGLVYFTHIDTTYIFGINVVIWSLIFWKFFIKRIFEKKRAKSLAYAHENSEEIRRYDQLLSSIYNHADAYIISNKARKKLGECGDDFVYGEIEFLSFFSILLKVTPQPHDIFYDLGCGAGKAVLTAAFCFNLNKACGVELLPELYALANTQKDKAKQLTTDKKRLDRIHFYNDNFLEHNFSEATILFINATCISKPIWELLLKKIMLLKAGSRIILTSKEIQHDKFQLISSSKELMSWGMNLVTIYLKTN